MMKRWLAAAAWLAASALPAALHADPVAVDRAVVRFAAPETGGARHPRFVFEQELSFEARLESAVRSGSRFAR